MGKDFQGPWGIPSQESPGLCWYLPRALGTPPPAHVPTRSQNVLQDLHVLLGVAQMAVLVAALFANAAHLFTLFGPKDLLGILQAKHPRAPTSSPTDRYLVNSFPAFYISCSVEGTSPPRACPSSVLGRAPPSIELAYRRGGRLNLPPLDILCPRPSGSPFPGPLGSCPDGWSSSKETKSGSSSGIHTTLVSYSCRRLENQLHARRYDL